MKSLLTISVLLLHTLGYAQIPDSVSTTTNLGSVSGKIVNTITMNPISYASVFLYQDGKIFARALCDSNGVFTLANVSPGQYSLQAGAFKYRDYILKSVTVRAESTSQVGTLLLNPKLGAVDTDLLEEGSVTTGVKLIRTLSQDIGYQGGEIEVRLFIPIAPYMRKNLIIKERIPKGFTAKEVESAGSDFSFSEERVIFKFRKYTGEDTLSLSYTLVIPDTVKGEYSIRGHVFGGKKEYFEAFNEMALIPSDGQNSWNFNLDKSDFVIKRGVRLHRIEDAYNE